MTIFRSACSLMTAGALLMAPQLGLAQNATSAPPPRTAQLKVDLVPSLIVMTSAAASLDGQRLTLTGVAPNSIVFADRPVRSAGHVLTAHVLEEWSDNDSFGKDPPNATVSVLSKDGDSVHDVVVELRNPKMEGDKLAFDVRVLEGDFSGADGPASVFIDIIGMPLTPLSFAGVARRTARRAAWYSMATAPHYPPPYGYPPPPNGYPYYPPPY